MHSGMAGTKELRPQVRGGEEEDEEEEKAEDEAEQKKRG